MKKNTTINLVLIGQFAAGIFFILFFKWEIFGCGVCGAATTLFYINLVGQRQLEKAGKRIDKIMKDQVLANESDNDNYITDDYIK